MMVATGERLMQLSQEERPAIAGRPKLLGNCWRLKSAVLVLLVFLGPTVSVNPQTVGLPDYSDAEKIVNDYFLSLQAGQVSQSLGFYGDPFFDQTSRAEWDRGLRALLNRTGAPRHWSLQAVNVVPLGGTGRDGLQFTLDYSVEYTHRSSMETFTLRPVASGQLKLVGHAIVLLSE